MSKKIGGGHPPSKGPNSRGGGSSQPSKYRGVPVFVLKQLVSPRQSMLKDKPPIVPVNHFPVHIVKRRQDDARNGSSSDHTEGKALVECSYPSLPERHTCLGTERRGYFRYCEVMSYYLDSIPPPRSTHLNVLTAQSIAPLYLRIPSPPPAPWAFTRLRITSRG